MFCVMFGVVGTGSAAMEAEAAGGPTVAVEAPNTVTGFGGAPDLDAAGGLAVSSPVLDVAPHPAGDGYWLVAADGGVFAFGDAQFFGSLGGTAVNAPVVDIAATPTGDGYWLVAADGGVFTFGDAKFRGSLGGQSLSAPIFGIAAAPAGDGYWLVAADGGVFAFGDAGFYGSGIEMTSNAPVVELAPNVDGDGYWLLGADGGVFTFGDAVFRGSDADPHRDAIGIAAAPGGQGYWIVRRSGVVEGFGVASVGDVSAVPASGVSHPAIGIAPRAGGGYWIAQGEQAPVVQVASATAAPDISQHPFLVCTRRIESGGDYSVVSASGTYRGAYQFARSTWDSTARHAGRLDLVGVDPAAAAPADQDAMALHLYGWQGARPWLGRCAGR